jgi:carbon-monoxide dehydrogenase medium subunit
MVVVHRSDGGVDASSIALVSMGGTPLRAGAAEDVLSGGGSPAEAAALVVEGTEPSTDHAGSAEYRAHLAQVLAMRAIEQALAG